MAAREIGAAKFKEQVLSILDELDPDGVVITKHGQPVARLIPIEADCGRLIGSFKGKIRIKGDILSTSARWNAQP